MTLELDSNGLPQAGRGLDHWLALNVMGWHKSIMDWVNDDGVWQAYAEDPYNPYSDGPWSPSTSHAYHQVMEAMESCERQFRWVTYGSNDAFNMLLWDKDWKETKRFWEVEVKVADYPGRLHAEAHAVCAAMWEAKKGESNE